MLLLSRRAPVALAAAVALALALAGVAGLGTGVASADETGRHHSKPRTVVTTDMEQDDLASLIRYLLYTDDVDTQGIIYTSSRFHWAGDGQGTEFFLPGREYTTPQTSWRWTGTRTIQDQVLKRTRRSIQTCAVTTAPTPRRGVCARRSGSETSCSRARWTATRPARTASSGSCWTVTPGRSTSRRGAAPTPSRVP